MEKQLHIFDVVCEDRRRQIEVGAGALPWSCKMTNNRGICKEFMLTLNHARNI